MTLQNVMQCPACESTRRSLLHSNVPDFVFHASDETWNIVRCEDCASLYLSQRPSPDAIGRYYQRYYTHVQAPDSQTISGIAVHSSALSRLANSWRNVRYGTHRPSLGYVGALVMVMLTPLRRWVDAECRHIPPAGARSQGFSVQIGRASCRERVCT